MKKLIYPFAFALVLSSCSFSIGEKSGVSFCETCDEDLKCENESESFPAGEQVFIRLHSNDPFGIDVLKTKLIFVDGKKEKVIDSSEEEINPEWNTFCKGLTLNEPGEYKVIFSDGAGEVIDEGTMTYE